MSSAASGLVTLAVSRDDVGPSGGSCPAPQADTAISRGKRRPPAQAIEQLGPPERRLRSWADATPHLASPDKINATRAPPPADLRGRRERLEAAKRPDASYMPPAREATHSTASLAAPSHWSSVTRILRTTAPSSTNTSHCPNVSPRTDTLVLVFDSSHSIFPRVSSRRLLRQSPSSLLPAWTMRAILPESGQMHNLQVGNSTASLMKSPRRIGTRIQPSDDPVTTLTARHPRWVPRWSGPHAPTRKSRTPPAAVSGTSRRPGAMHGHRQDRRHRPQDHVVSLSRRSLSR